MDRLEEDVGPHGSRMDHSEGARTVVLSSNGMIYLIVLYSEFVQLCRYHWHAGPTGPPICDGGHVPPVPPSGCATDRGCFYMHESIWYFH